MAVNPNKADEDAHGDLPSADICLHLARHGVKADAQQVTAGDLDIGELLLSRAADEGIDLVVMGAYGHARWREVVLGGVTRHMLAEMTVPVLMSH
jgi:nucleotide-binding universal stress UspA family protein